ncbi:MAG: sulfite exporter TauE/SafE family protein [Holosporales bacterium]|jgi:uncharacterized membrane protein YfcA|nr:sulfite exporter TauE/SafE family protein [Holosporales bacterium]
MFKVFFPVIGSFFDPLLVFAIGLFGGFLSGFLGIGSGIMITPVLMEFGIHPLFAVSNQICHAVGVNMTNFLMYKREQDVDFHLASYILFGGGLGAVCEWFILMRSGGTPDNAPRTFATIYATVLVILGITMLVQSIKAWREGMGRKYADGVMMRRWMLYLPLHKIFVRSRTEMSVTIPIFVGFVAGVLVSYLGGGENLLMAPVITYLIGRVSSVVNGTTALAGCVIASLVAMIYACSNYCCDIEFVMILFAGATLGSWLGVKLSYNVRRCYVTSLASITIFLMASRQIFKLINNSLTPILAPQIPARNSFFADIAHDTPMLYTITCIFLVTITALISEKILLWLTNMGSKRRAQR